jgi:adenosine deaminase
MQVCRCAVAIVLALSAVTLFAQRRLSIQGGTQATSEQRVEAALDKVRQDPSALRAFLASMPKGADLHTHLSGAVYAETYLRNAAEDNICVDPVADSFTRPVSIANTVPPQAVCGDGKLPASQVFKDQGLYDALINAFSMRGFVSNARVGGHDHFFAAFSRFAGIDPRHIGEWIDEVVSRGAAQNEQYIELMASPPAARLPAIVREVGWHDDFGLLRQELLAHGLRDDIGGASALLDRAESARRDRERCGTSDEHPACEVQVRYIYSVARASSKELVFAQTLFGFELASTDRRVVGINFSQPEDASTSMTDYALHMRIVGFLHGVYPRIHISLHAGELVPGLVPPEGLCCHIKMAVEEGRAERIGHGVDVMYENNATQLLKEMATRHVMVEINLTSNDLILGVSGKNHPLPIYRESGVPVALSTDDEGVSRIDLTHEYVRAVHTYGLKYRDLKQMVRTSLEHSFLSGASLWSEPDALGIPATPCTRESLGADKPSPSCAAFLKSSDKAQQQWELERRFRLWESAH